MPLPTFPEFSPFTLEMRNEICEDLRRVPHAISEFTFANLYLFRESYSYKAARLPDGNLIISGMKSGESFVFLPFGIPEDAVLFSIFQDHIYIKNLAEEYVLQDQITLEQKGFCIIEDRDNFDYIYLKKDLANLPGKKYHKKRNLVHQFLNNYEYSEIKIDESNLKDAYSVLEQWGEGRDGNSDMKAAREALDLIDTLKLCGYLYYVDGTPAAYVLGEPIAKGKGFVVHFEKAVGSYKGIYQFINKAFASILPNKYSFINREQDLGDKGLRQAKMTYRPSGFVKKYRVYVEPTCPCPQE